MLLDNLTDKTEIGVASDREGIPCRVPQAACHYHEIEPSKLCSGFSRGTLGRQLA